MDGFYRLQKNAAAGVDGVTWREYEKILPQQVAELHRTIHTGAYRATPSRRVYIPKADGRQRPLGIVSIEDKIAAGKIVRVTGGGRIGRAISDRHVTVIALAGSVMVWAKPAPTTGA